ncbi:MAG: DUF4173 domain-containing protein [Bacteroidales bacterium]|nr:DUF4173 domain-containing protein [Bacteroidales bacterium]
MNNKSKFWLLIVGTVIFTAVFWKQSIGVNSLIFSVFIVLSLLLTFPESRKSKYALFVYFGTIISSLSIVYHGSVLAIFVWIMSLFFLQPIVQYSELRTLFFAGFSGIVEYLTSFTVIGENVKKGSKASKSSKKIFKIVRFVIIPIVAFFAFYWIYKAAVPTFDNLTDSIFGKLNRWLTNIFQDISFEIIFMVLWGFLTTLWYLYKKKSNNIIIEEAKYQDEINRKRGKEFFKFGNPRGLKPLLKYENTIALILVIAVNVLLLTVNFLDITTIWFGFEYTQGFDLKQFVHEGTYLLIFSILLSMGIMLFYFRSNLNFFSKNKALKIATYIWIAQNLVLLISVVIRNLHYIEHFALAYLRIGLFFFLALVIVGLITLSLKIKDKKSLFYLLKTNTWALYIGFVLFAVPDWDTFIAKYNLNHYPNAFVEASYMLTLDEKVYPLIDQNQELLLQDDSLNTYRYFSDSYDVEFERKVNDFMNEYPEKSWLSWNYKDYLAYKYFKD